MTELKRKSCQLGLFSLLAVIFLFPAPAVAQSAAQLENIAQSLMTKEADPRLRKRNIILRPLPANASRPDCTHPPHSRWNSAQRSGNVSIAISCNKPAWRIYVSGTIEGELPVVASKRDLQSGETLTPDDLHIQWLSARQVRQQHLTRIEDTLGATTRQYIPANTPLSSNQIRPAQLVTKGNRVRILAINGGIQIEMAGTALESGEKDKQIRVQNLSSGKVIKGKVIAADTILVP